MKKELFILCMFAMSSLSAQQGAKDDTLKQTVNQLKSDMTQMKNLKITGWVQTQFQHAESKGAKTFDGGDFLPLSDNRFMLRRARVKFTYTNGLFQGVMQLNATERGVNLVEYFGKITDPWTKSFTLTTGVMNRPFGFEIQQSSADRETPERARFTQTLLPNERDLGAMLTFQPVKGKKLYGLKVDAGFFNGVGIAVPGTTSLNGAGVVDFDSYKDFIGRAHYKKSLKEDKIQFGIGVSHYNGGFVYQNNRVFDELATGANGLLQWQMRDTMSTALSKGGKAPRKYYGADFQLSVKSKIGTTTIRGEYITGTQSGMIDESKSPSTLPAKMDTYLRTFNGGYAYLIQRLGKFKSEIALKYEWYDPNTKLSSVDFGVGTTMSKAELKYTMLGIGYNYYYNDNVKLMVYYNMVTNENATGIAGFDKDLKDDVFTVRMQYRF
jgi:phosphate-selective porin